MPKLRAIALVLQIALLLLAGAAGQEPTFHTQSTVVMVPALVRDKDHNTVYGLKAQDFIVEDDGVPQHVQLDEAAEANPAAIAVVIQLGRLANYELPKIHGLASMLSPLVEQGHAKVAILTFDSRVQTVRNFTGDSDRVAADLNQLQPGDGGAAILDAVTAGLTLLNNTPRNQQRVLLLVSETRDHGSRKKSEDLLRGLGMSNIVLYALTFSPAKSNVMRTLRGENNPDFHPDQTEVHEGADLLAPLVLLAQGVRKNVARTLATITGGEYATFLSGKSFDRDMTLFSNDLYNRYALSFAPSNPHPGLHRIRVQLSTPNGATVLARSSYWVEGGSN